MKVIVYTTNLGGYDDLHDIPEWTHFEQPDYLYYTDGEAPKGWIKVEMEKGGRKASRFYKINSHLLPPHDISIYIDACYRIKRPLNQLVNFVEKTDIAICPHHHRKFKRHAEMCIALGLDDKETIQKMMVKYGNLDIPLTENSLIVRRNNDIIKELNELWWEEYQSGSCRDQLSLPYALDVIKPKLTILPFSARDNKYIHGWHQHRKNKNI